MWSLPSATPCLCGAQRINHRQKHGTATLYFTQSARSRAWKCLKANSGEALRANLYPFMVLPLLISESHPCAKHFCSRVWSRCSSIGVSTCLGGEMPLDKPQTKGINLEPWWANCSLADPTSCRAGLQCAKGRCSSQNYKATVAENKYFLNPLLPSVRETSMFGVSSSCISCLSLSWHAKHLFAFKCPFQTRLVISKNKNSKKKTGFLPTLPLVT